MRRISILALTMLVAACSKVSVEEATDNRDIRTYFCVSSVDTRTSFSELDDDVFHILWSDGDRITVNGSVSQPLELTSRATSATFVIEGAVTPPYSVIYPAEARNDDGKVVIPSTQVYLNGQFDPSAQIMMGYSQSTSVSMNAATAFIRVTIRKGSVEDRLRSIKLYTYDGTPLSGVYAPDFANGTLKYDSRGCNYIIVTSPEGLEYTDGKIDAVFAIPAGSYESGFAVAAVGVSTDTVYQMGRRVTDFTSSHVTTLEAGKVYPLKAVTFEDDGLTFSGGNGTKEAPYRIATAEDLVILQEASNGTSRDSYLGCHYIQMADISLKGVSWSPIAAAGAFTGTYDGQGHYISDLTLEAVGGYPSFMSQANGATIRDIAFGTSDGETYDGTSCIALDKLSSTGWTFMGLFANICDTNLIGIVNHVPFVIRSTANAKVCLAAICGGFTGASSAVGCINRAPLTNDNGDTEYRQNVLGGCFGSVYSSKTYTASIKDCHNYGIVHAGTGSCQFVGGVLGKVETTTASAGRLAMENCTNHANVENVSSAGYSKKYIHIGGIIGASINTTIDSCTNEADLSGSTAVWHQTFGGIIGYPQSTVMTGCVNNGSMSTDATTGLVTISVGGIVGWTQNTNVIDDCTNNGAIYASRPQVVRCGGIAGTIEKTSITSCINNGSVTADQRGVTGDYFQAAGGIVGYVLKNNADNSVSGCINKGAVSLDTSISSSIESVLLCAGGVAGIITPVGKYSNNTNSNASVTAANEGSSPSYAGGVFGMDFNTAVTEMRGNACRNSVVTASGSNAAAGGVLGASLISTVISTNRSINTTVRCTEGKGAGSVVGYNTSTIDATSVSGIVNGTVLTAENYLDHVYGTSTGTVSNTTFSTQEEYDFSGGSGIPSDPYIIATAQDLAKLGELTSSGAADSYAAFHYRQSSDIDMSGVAWTPIGGAASFSGGYDGAGHRIFNLVYDAFDGNPSFIVSAVNATIRNIVFGSVDGKSYDGKSRITLGTKTDAANWTFMGLIATAEDSTVEGIVNYIPFSVLSSASVHLSLGAVIGGIKGVTTVSACENHAAVSDMNGDSSYMQNVVGGCFGTVLSSGTGSAVMDKCVNGGEVSATTASCNHMGGVLGKVETSAETVGCLSMSECRNTANVFNTASSSYSKCYIHIGGICGSSINSTFEACRNEADLMNTTAPMHQTYAGIVAYPQKTTIMTCVNVGSLTSDTSDNTLSVSIGGIAGWTQNTNTIDGCTNDGAIYGRRDQVVRCGGIAGTVENTDIVSCTNNGTVTLDQSSTASAYWQVAGGIVGFVSKNSSSNYISGCANKGNVDLRASVSSTASNVLVSAGGIVAVIGPGGKYSENMNSGASVSASNTGTSPCYAGGVFGLDYTTAVTEMKGNINNHGDVSASGTASAAGGFIGGSTISTAITGNSSYNSSVTCTGSRGAGAVVGYNTSTIADSTISGTVNGVVLTEDNYGSYEAGSNSGSITGTRFAEAVTYSFSGGKGTQTEPFLIGTAEDLRQLGVLTNNGNAISYNARHYAMNCDIDMTGKEFTPICGSVLIPFEGSFKGNGHSISALNSDGGLFCNVDGGTISGVELKDAHISGLAETGAICNVLYHGSITGCSVKGGSQISSSGGNVGGIVGLVSAREEVLVDGCSVLAPVSGLYNIGGIVGKSTSSPGSVALTNCVFAGTSLTGSGSVDGFCSEGGIVGLMENKAVTSRQDVLNCAAVVPRIGYPSASTPCAGGILGRMEGPASLSSVQGCWSTFQLCYLWKGDYNMTKAIDNNDKTETLTYGAIVGACPSDLGFRYCFWFDSTKMGPTGLTNASDCRHVGPMASLKDKLHDFVTSYSGPYSIRSWSTDTRDYPVPAGLSTDNPGHNQVRVSVIGASVSTFRSWITIGNAVYYYDGRSGFDVSYDDTYWYRLANKITNARIEKNIAWSGSCMASCDNQLTKPGFITRYNTYGIGSPDVIILAGPANESSRNKSGVTVDATEGYAYNVEVPDSALDKLYSTPVEQLDERYFLDATVKMVQKLHAAHPKAILVLEIYDYYLTEQMAHGIARIGNHYDYVTLVDFYADGYNNIPKYSGHPIASGHEKMATKIYNAIKSDL